MPSLLMNKDLLVGYLPTDTHVVIPQAFSGSVNVRSPTWQLCLLGYTFAFQYWPQAHFQKAGGGGGGRWGPVYYPLSPPDQQGPYFACSIPYCLHFPDGRRQWLMNWRPGDRRRIPRDISCILEDERGRADASA